MKRTKPPKAVAENIDIALFIKTLPLIFKLTRQKPRKEVFILSELRKKMKMDLELRGYSPITVKNYLEHVSRFSKHFNQSPELLGEDDIREYLYHCITEKKLSEGSVNAIYSGLKFFHTKTLSRGWNLDKLSPMKEPKKLPVVLSQSEVKAILE
ncbi:MAG: phage integrase N-terminal SAM-like domain-containing protein, partial [Clostridiaceae bacterium]|nr:phage integrase N-terminal SAM-like domain-containing protein [Clostridiaceae bacterium]